MPSDSITHPLHEAINYGLELQAALKRGESRQISREQSVLTNLVLEIPAPEEAGGKHTDRGARYAVVCWLDELFTCYSEWANLWNEHKLESALYGGNDRAWEFWRQAKLAEARPTDEVLSAYYLCVALGFRGELRHSPDKLHDWTERTKARLTRVPSIPPTAATRRIKAAKPLKAVHRMRRFSLVAAAVTLCLLPLATFALVQRLFG